MKKLTILFLAVSLSFILNSNTFSSPVTVNGSVSLDYPDLTSAFDAVNAGTHGNGAITVLINESHTLTSPAILNGGVFTSCEIKPTADVTITGTFPRSSTINLYGADRVTIDGRIGTVDVIRLTLTGGIEMTNGASDNVVKFVKAVYGVYIYQVPLPDNLRFKVPGYGGNDNINIEDCMFDGQIVSDATPGDSGYPNTGIKILRNTCSEIIMRSETKDVEIRDNTVFGSFRDVSIYLLSVGIIKVTGNKARGITCFPTDLTSPGSSITEVNISNNFFSANIYRSCNDFLGCDLFITLFYFSTQNVTDINADISYNTIFLGGSATSMFFDFVGIRGCIINVTTGNVIFKNNIVDSHFLTGGSHPSSRGCIIGANSTANLDADYNCYYCSYGNNHGHISGFGYDGNNITDYKAAAFPNEQHTIFKDINFANITTGDLHLAGASIMDEELQGIQIPGITTDIDGELRTSPFRGADEADYLLPVELTSFTSSLNNNDVQLNWTTASETNNSGFDVERSNVKGQSSDEWMKIGFIKGNGTTTSPNNYTFTDNGLNAGKYKYRLKQIDFNGNIQYYNLSNEVTIGVPDKYSLSQNYPNPFNPSTVLSYSIIENVFVKLKLYDVLGNEIATLVNEKQNPGTYNFQFSTVNYQLSSGIYFYKLEAGNFIETKRMILLK